MARRGSRQIIIAGGGIAGLTAALAFARARLSGAASSNARRSFDEIGAGLQLSPNATRILERARRPRRPEPAPRCGPTHVALRDATSLAELARVPLGESAEQRWGAPYLVAHRADLQSALLAHAPREPGDPARHRCGGPRFRACTRDGVTASIDRWRQDRRSLRPAADRRRRRLVEPARAWPAPRARAAFPAASPGAPTIRADSAAGKILAGDRRRRTASRRSCIRAST